MSDDRFRIWLLESKSPNWVGDNYAIQPEHVSTDALRAEICAQGGEPSDLCITLVDGGPHNRSGAHRHAFDLAERHRRLVTPLWPEPAPLEIADWRVTAEAMARIPARRLREDGVMDPRLGVKVESDEQFRQRLMAEMREQAPTDAPSPETGSAK